MAYGSPELNSMVGERRVDSVKVGQRLMLLVIAIGGFVCMSIGAGLSAAAEEDVFSAELAPEKEAESAISGEFLVEIIRESIPPEYAGKTVLIYHTHTYEAYEQEAGNEYEQTEKWRTKDSDHNVIAVGSALAASLRAMGISVEHDTTGFELPDLENAYERSLAMLEQRRQNGETYDLYIDLHRDAIASTSTIKRTVNIGGEDVARFMVLVGKGTTGGYEEKPDWEANLAIAERITEALNDQCQSLARDVKIKTGRFNQHIADRCILIECGMNYNTLDEVLAGIPYLAHAVAQALSE